MSTRIGPAGKTVIAALKKNPDIASRTLARDLAKKHPGLYKTVESARSIIRRYRGQDGAVHRRALTDRSVVTKPGDARRSSHYIPGEARILVFDIETSPNLAYVWGCLKQYITADQLVETSTVLCWAAKWLHEDEIMFSRVSKVGDDKQCVKKLRDLFNQADIVVAHNGQAFDVRTLNTRWLYHRLMPPAPYQVIDTCKLAEGLFRFPRNKLENIAQYLRIGGKVEHEGFALWRKIVERNDPEAWARMEKYNKQDVVLLEKVYLEIRAWDKRHPNVAMFYDDKARCTVCGAAALKPLPGGARTALSVFPAFQCQVCGHVVRSSKREKPGLKIEDRMTNVR